MSDLADQFIIEYSDQFDFSSVDYEKIERSLTRSAGFISYSVYGQTFYQDALFLQTASFLYSSDQSNHQQVLSRRVDGEYAVTYANTATKNNQPYNPYEQQLDQIKRLLGIGFGMILRVD